MCNKRKKATSARFFGACVAVLAGGGLAVAQPALGADDRERSPVAPVMPEKSALPSIGAIMKDAGIDIHGYVDTSYTYLSDMGNFTSGVPTRVFDRERNSFNLHALDLSIAKLPAEGFGGMVELLAGSDADVVAAAGTGASDQFDVNQAYFHYAKGPFMAIAGKYVTLAGAEVIRSPDNLNFSRSILFGYAIPFTHTGVRGYYSLNSKARFILGVNNGWDNLKDENSQKTVELGVALTPAQGFTLGAQYYGGKEGMGANTGMRNLIDVVATYSPIDPLTFVINYDYGTQKNAVTPGETAKWSGVAGYVNYKFHPMWRVALRGEYFDDQDGFRTGVIQKWKEATATLAYMPTSHVEIRGEVRADRSDQAAFLRTDGSASKNQRSFGLEAIFKF